MFSGPINSRGPERAMEFLPFLKTEELFSLYLALM